MRIAPLAVASFTLGSLQVAIAAAGIIEGYPDVIVCRTSDARVVGYLHRVFDDGSAVYMGLAGGFATVTPDGVLHRDGAMDCDGKTLKQLEEDGQAQQLD